MRPKYTNRQELLEATGHSPIECLYNLEAQFPQIKKWLYDKKGELRPQVWFFVNGEKILRDDLNKTLNDGDEVFVLLAIGGG